MKKRLLTLLLSCILLLSSVTACGRQSSSDGPSLPAHSPQPSASTATEAPTTAVPSIPNPQRFFQRVADVTRSESDGTAAYTLQSKKDLQDAVLAYCDLLTGEYGLQITFSSHFNGDLTYHLCYNGPVSIQKTDTFDIMVNYFGNDHPSTNGNYGASIRIKQSGRFELVSVKQYSSPSSNTPTQTQKPAPSASPSPASTSTPSPTPSFSPAPSPSPSPTPSQKPEESVDPSSKLLPDLEAFLYRSASSRSYFGDTGRWGRWLKWNGSHPYVAYETITQELLDLLLDERYQLKLTKAEFTPHYSNRAIDYYFEYTGTSEEITLLTDEKGEYTFHVRLRFYPYPEHDYFQFSFAYNQNFVLEDPGKRTTRDITKGGDGSIITTPPDTGSDDDDFFKKCSSCHGSGKCTHCNGRGEVKKFQAGLGWVDLDCTLCNNGKCRHCNGTGKDR